MAEPFRKPQPIVEANRAPRHDASQMNSAVARITGMSRAVLTPHGELNETAPAPTQARGPGHPQAQLPPPPLARRAGPPAAQPQSHQPIVRNGLTQWDYTEADMQEATNRKNQSNRGPESSSYERGYDGARDNEARDQKMPRKTAKDRPYGTKDQDDDDEDEVGKTQPEDRQMDDDTVTEGSITHVAGLPMELFREMAGMTPIYDIQESQQYYADAVNEATGQVPTKRATSYTKMPAGYGQQEGGFAQSMHPQKYGHDGADAEMTFDQAIGMLKKEGLDRDYVWSRFLSENNLSIPILEMLCDEAMDTGNQDMAEELTQLEDAFEFFYESSLVETFGPELAEGLLSKIMGKKKAQASGAPRQAMGKDVTPAGSGVTVGKGAPGPKGTEAGTVIKLKKVGGAPPKKADQSVSTIPKFMRKKMAGMGEDRMPVEADDDGGGNPRMPWDGGESSFDKLSAKYGGSKSAA